MKPKKIIYNNEATIVFWIDGTKTVVKKAPDEPDNRYAAFCAALAIKTYGSNSALKRTIADGEKGIVKSESDERDALLTFIKAFRQTHLDCFTLRPMEITQKGE